MKCQILSFMNKVSFFIFLFFLLTCIHVSAQQKRWAARGYRKVETKVVDHDEPDKSGRIIERIDKRGNVLESWEWNEKDRLIKHIVNIYSKNKFQSTVFSGNDSIRSLEIIEYDKKGRKIRQFSSDKRKAKDEETRTDYDKWGNKIQERLFKNDKLVLTKTFSYNNENLLEKQVHVNADGIIIFEKTYQYSK